MQRPRHFSPPQEAWIEDQTMKMIKNQILSRAGPNAFVSCLHLAKKNAAPSEAEAKLKWGAVNVANMTVCERAARTFGGSLHGLVPPEALEALEALECCCRWRTYGRRLELKTGMKTLKGLSGHESSWRE